MIDASLSAPETRIRRDAIVLPPTTLDPARTRLGDPAYAVGGKPQLDDASVFELNRIRRYLPCVGESTNVEPSSMCITS
jgi:hypothetical protein